MNKPPKAEYTIVRVKHGRAIEIQPQVLLWRKRNERFKKLKAELVQIFGAKNMGPAEIKAWLNSPIPSLRNRAPKEMLNPYSIEQLLLYVRKTLK